MQFLKQNITGIILGICITVSAFHAWIVYDLRLATVQNSQNIQAIIEVINKAQAPATATQ